MADYKMKPRFKDSKLKNSMNPIFKLHFIFGYDYGLFRTKSVTVQKLIKVACTIIVFVLAIIVLIIEIITEDLNTMYLFGIQYCIEALTTIYIFGHRIINHFNRYEEIDEKLRIKDKHYKKIKWDAIISMIAILLLTLAYMGSRNFENGKIIKASCMFIFILDISFILRINLFNSIHYRIMKLRKYIEKYYAPELYCNESQTKCNEMNGQLHLTLYKRIADQYDDINKSIGLLVSIHGLNYGIPIFKLN